MTKIIILGKFTRWTRAVVWLWMMVASGSIAFTQDAASSLVVGQPSSDGTQWQILTDTQGRTLRAQIMAVNDTVVSIRREDGQTFTVQLATLSDATQMWLKAWRLQHGDSTLVGEIKLMSGWKTARHQGEEQNVIGDLQAIFGTLVEPSDNTTVTEPLTLYRDVQFLDTIEVAKAKLRLSNLSKADFILPGFPNRSFSIYRGSGNFDGYENITLLTDIASQVVAVQLSSSKQQQRRSLSEGRNGRQYLLYDILDYSMRAIPDAQVSWGISYEVTNQLRQAAQEKYQEARNQWQAMQLEQQAAKLRGETPAQIPPPPIPPSLSPLYERKLGIVSGEKLVALESAFLVREQQSINGRSYIGGLVPKYTTRLYIPKQIISLVLFNITQNW